jgi:hypothetical protein
MVLDAGCRMPGTIKPLARATGLNPSDLYANWQKHPEPQSSLLRHTEPVALLVPTRGHPQRRAWPFKVWPSVFEQVSVVVLLSVAASRGSSRLGLAPELPEDTAPLPDEGQGLGFGARRGETEQTVEGAADGAPAMRPTGVERRSLARRFGMRLNHARPWLCRCRCLNPQALRQLSGTDVSGVKFKQRASLSI